MKTYFILGTDTGCGKTYATIQLIKYLKQQDTSVMALKPIASGCEVVDGTLLQEDVAALEQALGDTYQPICGWKLMQPISPHLAAKFDGVILNIEDIAAFCTAAWLDKYTVLIEGAGGLMVPLNAKDTWVEFLQHTKFPVILVVGMRLGCLNHALLTAHALQTHGIECAGWVANYIDPLFLASNGNMQTLLDKIPWPLLGCINYQGVFDVDTLTAATLVA